MVTLLMVMSIALAGAGIGLMIGKIIRYDNSKSDMYGRDKPDVGKPPRLGMEISIATVGVALLLFIMGNGIIQVRATEIAVVENTVSGKFYSVLSGTHIWPFTRNIVPFISRVHKYDLRRQVIEIGETPENSKAPDGKSETQAFGIPSASDSPGQPVVFIRARGWAMVNPEKVVELHRRYGADYLNRWVEAQWISAVKAVQGQHQYDHLKTNRVQMEDEIEQALQAQLLDTDEVAIVIVSQLAVVDYDYEPTVNQFLESVAQMEFTRQQAEQQVRINEQTQNAERIRVETDYMVIKRSAEAEQARLIAEATGRSEATKLEADAEAYRITAAYEAESAGVQLVQGALARSPEAYLEYQRTLRWNGVLPQYMFGNSTLPFIQLPNVTNQPQ